MKKVLLINDSRLQNEVMKDMLTSINYEVSVTDEYNAIAAVHNFCPDVIITNYVMKEINGDQLAAVIKIQYPNIKIVISSSNAIDINDFDRNKVSAVIRMPIGKDDLKMVLESISTESEKKYDDSDSYEVKKYCKQCDKFVDVTLSNKNFLCPFCGDKI
ncbi:MAG: response regulator [Clostridiaceae bacterium]|jgi:CheY-like chemotaxis protein|nr:response regulator [Clostridiaceae bacterium]